MRTFLPSFGFLFLFSLTAPIAVAQDAKEQNGAALQSCLMGTGVNTWRSLKLSQDQLRRMTMIQEACKESCEAAGGKPSKNSISHEDGSTILGEVRNVLSATQYDQWLNFCAGGEVGDP